MTGERDRRRTESTRREREGRARVGRGRERDGDLPAARINMLYAPEAGAVAACSRRRSRRNATRRIRQRDPKGGPVSLAAQGYRSAEGNSGDPRDRDVRILPSRSLASRALLRCVLGPRDRDVRSTDRPDGRYQRLTQAD